MRLSTAISKSTTLDRESIEIVKENTDWLKDLEGAEGSKWQLTPNYCIHRLRKLLSQRATYGLPGTDGTFWSCFILHLKQDHTVLSLYYGHPLHPFSREERLLFLLVSACWIFFVSVESQQFGRFWSIVLTLIMVVPFKKLVRLILECPCFYTKAYTFKHEIDDDETEGEEGHRGMECVLAAAGHAASIAMFFGALFLTCLGGIKARHMGWEFVTSWFLSQVISLGITEVAIMGTISALHMYVHPNEVKKFHEKWKPHFDGKGLPMPTSMTDVALKAKKDYIRISGVTKFYLHYREFDEWFVLGDSESSLHEMGAVTRSGGEEMRFGENPMHAGPPSTPPPPIPTSGHASAPSMLAPPPPIPTTAPPPDRGSMNSMYDNDRASMSSSAGGNKPHSFSSYRMSGEMKIKSKGTKFVPTLESRSRQAPGAKMARKAPPPPSNR